MIIADVPFVKMDLILMLSLALFMSSCSSGTQPVSGVATISSPSLESQDNEIPTREIVSSYDNLRAKPKEPESVCRVITINNIAPERAVESISRAVPNIIAVKNDDSRTVIIRGDENDVKQACSIIGSIDKKIPQIYIEGKVVEVTESGLSDIGVIWGKEQGSFKFAVDKNSGGISQADNILGTINALVASGKAKMLANPKITALDGKEAEINIGSRIPYAVPSGSTLTSTLWSIQYIDAGVNLKITSTVAGDGTIVSNIKPEVSNVSEWRTTSAGEFPVISTRNASVTVRIKDGETLVIGGLLNESDRENTSGIPVLSDIPLLGGAFKTSVTERSKSDVLFLITPHLMR